MQLIAVMSSYFIGQLCYVADEQCTLITVVILSAFMP